MPGTESRPWKLLRTKITFWVLNSFRWNVCWALIWDNYFIKTFTEFFVKNSSFSGSCWDWYITKTLFILRAQRLLRTFFHISFYWLATTKASLWKLLHRELTHKEMWAAFEPNFLTLPCFQAKWCLRNIWFLNHKAKTWQLFYIYWIYLFADCLVVGAYHAHHQKHRVCQGDLFRVMLVNISILF